MSVAASLPMTPGRLRRLSAMGVTVYRMRRGAMSADRSESVETAPDVAAEVAARQLVVVCDEPRGPVVDAILRALGAAESGITWCRPQQGRIEGLDVGADTYLVLGEHLARVVGADLPTAAQQSAMIVVTSAPAGLRGNAMAKRLLWRALRPLKRRLATAG
ncbi:hypothetical protein [Tahibacter amnicola]|uniref:Uncharacterized protein n=1 Tax=Tahibacter amnicola TaxID=2976241 RepID=A0ABY6BI40_9GAMM|nr:hypothetical protein [Tahibacter amnicola]UXI69256.1 hypothetical protein N4264_06295 [Tahibacter amnicola]